VINERLESFIKNTFESIATQYPNLYFYAYDLSNELFLNDGGGIRPAGGPPRSHWASVYGANNDEFIINAFTYARKYAPAGCKLYINDYNEYIGAKTDDIYNIAMKLKKLGVIDGIGMQSHLATSFPSAAMYKTALEKFISTGLEVSITELDIETKGNESARAQLFKDVFQMAVDNAASIPSFTVWGTNDSVSWRKSESPLLFSQGYQPKPDYDAVMQVAANIKPAQTTATTTATTAKPVTTTKQTTTTTKQVTTAKQTTTSTTTTNTSTLKYGDVTCDGEVDIRDVLMLNKNLLLGEALSTQGIKNSDVDGDGKPTSADALLILQFTVSLVKTLPV
jgi:hypothetical protein